MEIDARHTGSSHRHGYASGGTPAERGEGRSTAFQPSDPAFIIDLGPRAARLGDGFDDTDETSAGPGKSADSPAHRARAFIAQFLALSDEHENPFKALGHIVSQIAQGRSFEEIFPAAKAEEEDNEALAAVQPEPTEDLLSDPVVEPAPTLLEVFAEQEKQDEETSAS